MLGYACSAQDPAPRLLTSGQVVVSAANPAVLTLEADASSAWLIEVQSQNIDVWIEVVDANGRVLSATDSPSRRSGPERALVRPGAGRHSVRLLSAEHPKKSATIAYAIFRIDGAGSRSHLRRLETERLETDAAAAFRAGRGRDSLEAYQASAERWRTQRLPVREAMALYRAAWIWYRMLSDPVSAASASEQAADIFFRSDEDRYAAESLLLAASTLAETGGQESIGGGARTGQRHLARARRHVARAEEILARYRDTYNAAEAIHVRASLEHYAGNFARARMLFDEAESHYRRLGEPEGVRKATANSAHMNYELGRFREAIDAYDRVFSADSPRSNPGMYADMLDNSAHARTIISDFEGALKQYQLALELHRELRDSGGEGRSLHGIGVTYYRMGSPARSIEYLEQAIAHRRVATSAAELVASLVAVASAYQDLSRSTDADEALQEALRTPGTPLEQQRVRLALARYYSANQDHDGARRLLESIVVDGSDDRKVIAARAALALGRTETELYDYEAAVMHLQQARLAFARQGTPTLEAEALYSLAEVKHRLGQSEAALEHVRAAIAIAERVRAAATNPDFRARFLSARRAMYDLNVNLLLDQYEAAQDPVQKLARLRSALIASDQTRARSLSELVMSANDRGGSLLPAEHRRLAADIASREYQLASLREQDANASLIESIRREVVDLRLRFDLNPPDDLRQSTRSEASPGSLPKGESVLIYFVSKSRSFVWRVQDDSLEGAALPAEAEISAAVMALRARLLEFGIDRRNDETQARLTAVSRILLPHSLVSESNTHWIIVPDGVIHYVPFAALPLPQESATPGRYAITQHTIRTAITYQSAVAIASVPVNLQITPERPAMLFGDPVFTHFDDRVSPPPGLQSRFSAPGVPRLRGSLKELEQISAHLKAAQPVLLTGFAATREAALSGLATRASLLHFATHASFDPMNPTRSGVQLASLDRDGDSIDGLLTLTDLAAASLHSDLVVLSSCESALGEALQAEGLIGLPHGFLSAGARAVISTQWRVSDAAMATLMDHFYTHAVNRAQPLQDALRSAQLDLLNTSRWRHPAYWAGTQLTVAR